MNEINRRDFLRKFAGQQTAPQLELPAATPAGMSRRSFLSILTTASIAAICDPLQANFDAERMLWLPSEKRIILAPAQVLTVSNDLAARFAAIIGPMVVDEPEYAPKVMGHRYAGTTNRLGTFIPLDADFDQVDREHLTPLARNIKWNLQRGALQAFYHLNDLQTVRNPPAYVNHPEVECAVAIDPITRVAVRTSRAFSVTENDFSTHFELLGRQVRRAAREGVQS